MNRLPILAWLLSGVALLAQTAPVPPLPPPLPPLPVVKPMAPVPTDDHAVLLVNAAGLPDEQMEALRAFAQRDLFVKVETLNLNADWSALPGRLPGLLTTKRLIVVALAKAPGATRILAAPDNGWAMVNVEPLLNLPEKREHMLTQQTMRGIGYAFGLAPCLDRYCCMRAVTVLPTLLDAGQNFCPITRQDYETKAGQLGFAPVRPNPRPVRPQPAE